MWKAIFTQTRREKRGSIDGINLFFGALLGANLGSLDEMSISQYTNLVVLLAGAVMTLRVLTTSERRGYAFALAALYVLMVGLFLCLPHKASDGLSQHERAQLGVTLGVWIVSILLTEFYPMREKPPEASAVSD